MITIKFTEAVAGRRRGERAAFDEGSAALLVAQRVAEYTDDADPDAGAIDDDESTDPDDADPAPAGRKPRRR